LTGGIAYRGSGLGRSCETVPRKSRIPDRRFLDFHRGVGSKYPQRGQVSSENRHLGFQGIEEQETRDHRNPEFAKSDFPTVRGDQWRVPVGEDSRQGIRGALSLFRPRSVKVLVEAGARVACAASSAQPLGAHP
jgi:hypothetical protein